MLRRRWKEELVWKRSLIFYVMARRFIGNRMLSAWRFRPRMDSLVLRQDFGERSGPPLQSLCSGCWLWLRQLPHDTAVKQVTNHAYEYLKY